MLKTNDLLLEIGCEELPANVVKPLATQIQQLLLECLTQKQISFGSNSTLATPRRVTIIIKDVASTTPTKTITKKGPYLDTALDELKKPKPPAVGFAKACGVTFDELSTIIDAKGERLSYEHTEPGQSIVDLFAIWLDDEVIHKISNIKMMRWGSHESLTFPRPVHWVLGKYGNTTIPGKLLGCPIQNQTFGHRFHHPKSLIIKNATTYADQLRQAHVEADMGIRKELIKKQITQITPKQHLALVDERLLDEVTQLVEWPEALLGEFDSSFLKLPPEALQAVMHKHQRCFLVKSKTTDQLAPFFITISNIKSTKPKQVIAGNRKVMRARLSDAMFFYEQDQQLSLVDHAKRLNDIVYQQQLGSLSDKTKRLARAAVKLAKLLSLDPDALQTSCTLCKADLVCSLVNEFPELHGAVGYHLALHEKINPKIADAILNHLKPTGGQDSPPDEPMAQALAILDKADHLVGFFGINQMPSGDKDPFALRRSAIGLLELILALPVSLSLDGSSKIPSRLTPPEP